MRKEITFGKVLGITFCILAAVCTVALLLFVNTYFGGQMKLINKYYTALERDDFEGYRACFSYAVAEEEFAKDRKEILILQDNENVHAKAKFDERVRHYAPGDEYYVVYYDLTVYNDNERIETGKQCITVYRENGKWFVRT